jgi:hypothetical protein
MNSPPIIGEDVENAQHHNQECGRPLGLEADGNHNTSSKTNEGDEDPDKAPFSLENESKEEENKEYSTCKKEANLRLVLANLTWWDKAYYFLRSFSVRLGRPANTDLREIIESLKTMKRPPMTLRLRRKKFMSKIRPYPNP